MQRILKKLSSLVLVLMIIFVWTIYTYDESAILTNAESVSNKQINWGIKRGKDHAQPDLGKTNVELIEKYDGMAMGDNNKKYVYLTFDSGYEAGYTEKILDVLKENEVPATFFITAHYLNSASDLVQRMIKEGHIIREPFSVSVDGTTKKSVK